MKTSKEIYDSVESGAVEVIPTRTLNLLFWWIKRASLECHWYMSIGKENTTLSKHPIKEDGL